MVTHLGHSDLEKLPEHLTCIFLIACTVQFRKAEVGGTWMLGNKEHTCPIVIHLSVCVPFS